MNTANIVIFGQTEASWGCLIEQALGQGYHVTALARTPAGVTSRHERLSVVCGDVLEPADVEKAIANQDAILWTIGGHDRLRAARSGRPRTPGLCAIGTRHVLDAMPRRGVPPPDFLSPLGGGRSKGR